MDPRGRSCPLAYRYRPEALAQPAQLEADTLYVVGGLYGNPAALTAVLKRADNEPGGPATIAFSSDFHWLAVDPEDFQTISEAVLAHHATKGNVEAELASEGSEEDAGCGCAYPDYVSDDVVDRSNQIITRLRATAARLPELVGRLGTLPQYLTAGVAGERVGIVHGDPESLASWRLALEAMEPGDPQVRRQVGWRGQPTTPTELLDWFGRAEVSVLASTHTGLPYAQAIADGRRRRLVINNGAAGLPAFAGTTYGVMTRLSSDPRPPPDSLTAPRSGPCATMRCRSASTINGGRSASWRSGLLAARPPLVFRPDHQRHPPAAGPGGTRRRPVDRSQRAAIGPAGGKAGAMCLLGGLSVGVAGTLLGGRPSHDDVGGGGEGGQVTGFDLVAAGGCARAPGASRRHSPPRAGRLPPPRPSRPACWSGSYRSTYPMTMEVLLVAIGDVGGVPVCQPSPAEGCCSCDLTRR